MLKIGVLISGGGTNLQALIDKVHGQDGEIVLVVSNREGAFGLVRAEEANIPTTIFEESAYPCAEDFYDAMVETLVAHGVELVVMAGYMRIVTPNFIKAYEHRIINIHPSLIPAFCGNGYYGMNVHRAVYDYGVKVSGATVHFVTEGADEGPIIAQRTVDITYEDSPEAIQQKVLAIEHELLPEVVAMACRGEVSVDGRRVRIAVK